MKYGNREEGISDRKNVSRMCVWIARALIVVAATGCVFKPDDLTKNETPTTLVTTGMPTTTDLVSSIEHTDTVSSAPKQLYIKAGQHEQFIYRGHNITINYTSAYPTQTVKITFDGTEKIIQKELTESPTGIYWREGEFSFTLLPVAWEIRDGQRGPSYGKSWNTTELYFEVLP